VGKKRFLKQIKSFENLIREHKEKIEKEKAKAVPDSGLIKYWGREVKVYTDEIVKASRRLKRGR
jgi:hypothetical protein